MPTPPQAQPATIALLDAAGHAHPRADASARIVSLVPSLTELLFDLGWRDREDPYRAPSPESPTLDALHLLAGAMRANGRPKGVNTAVAAVARAVTRA